MLFYSVLLFSINPSLVSPPHHRFTDTGSDFSPDSGSGRWVRTGLCSLSTNSQEGRTDSNAALLFARGEWGPQEGRIMRLTVAFSSNSKSGASPRANNRITERGNMRTHIVIRERVWEVRSASRAIRADFQLTWTVTYNPLLLPTYFLSKGKFRFCSHFHSNSGWTEVYQIQCKFLLMILHDIAYNAWLPLFNIFKSKTVLLGKRVSIA